MIHFHTSMLYTSIHVSIQPSIDPYSHAYIPGQQVKRRPGFTSAALCINLCVLSYGEATRAGLKNLKKLLLELAVREQQRPLDKSSLYSRGFRIPVRPHSKGSPSSLPEHQVPLIVDVEEEVTLPA